MSKEKEKKVFNFGEKTKEKWKDSKTNQWEELDVWQTPKYEQSKNKAIELIEDGKYCLDEGDFWILKNKGGKVLCYTGLIISHNGCLKINDKLEPKYKFSPSCVSFVKDEAEKVKVMQYINEEQGVYEFGEISPKNCMNDYPYAMVLKRLMDRVILKNSKVGFFGIYSDSESEDFKEKPEPKEVTNDPQPEKGQIDKSMEQLVEEKKIEDVRKKALAIGFAEEFKKEITNAGSPEEIESFFEGNKKLDILMTNYKAIYNDVVKHKDKIIAIMNEPSQSLVDDKIIDYTQAG